MLTAKEIRDNVDLDMSIAKVRNILDDSDIARKIGKCTYYYPSAIEKVKRLHTRLEEAKEKVKSVFNYYGRPIASSEPALFIKAGITFYLKDKGYSHSDIALTFGNPRTSNYHYTMNKKEAYQTDPIAKIIIEDVYVKCDKIFNTTSKV